MNNLKVKVRAETKEQSDEIQKLANSIGIFRPFNTWALHKGWVCIEGKEMLLVCDSCPGGEEEFKTITLAELRDMVKPKMKEYLDSKRNYEFVLSTDKEEGFIEIPEGADCLTSCNNVLIFWRGQNYSFDLEDDEDWVHYADGSMTLDYYSNFYKENGVVILWQRPTQPEELPFIDDEPQSLNDQYEEIEQVRQDVVNHPNHYTQGKVECIDALEAATVGKVGIEAVCVANVIKYLWRYEEKNGKEDIKKAQWYLNKLLDSID